MTKKKLWTILTLIILGPPYVLLKYPAMENILLTYKDDFITENVVAEAVCGQISIGGKLPVSLGNIASRGERETLLDSCLQLQAVDYHSHLPHPEYLDSLKQFLQKSIADSAFPGCAIAVGFQGDLLLQEGFGHYIYDPQSKKVNSQSIFDLASLTKVVVTTNVTMILYERGLLKLDWKVSEIIPAFKGPDKEKVTIRHLLTHSSGLPAWQKLYLNIKGKENIVQAICETGLEYQPGTDYVYSDLGMILMQAIIESIVQKPLDLFFTENIAIPLGLKRTFYNPESRWINEILPTEISDWHKRLVHGFVHDENAYAMGGVSGHAGLFSCIEDLAVICQLYLNGGIYAHQRIINTGTIELFTQRQNLVAGSTRALGWDTRSEQGSSAGDYMSLRAFGHTGFTGTSLWIDPEHQLFVVLLTNRVYTTRNNQKIQKVRPLVHNYVMKAIQEL